MASPGILSNIQGSDNTNSTETLKENEKGKNT